MKLLHIASDSDRCIDEALVPVPDDFDRDSVLDEVESVVSEPYIKTVYRVEPLPGHVVGVAEYRNYYG